MGKGGTPKKQRRRPSKRRRGVALEWAERLGQGAALQKKACGKVRGYGEFV
jgi:hypothetical protein